MSTKHTPGPWPIERRRSSITSIGPCVADEYAGAAWLDVPEEDARLIAAAPDYHEAADWIRQAVANNAAPVNPIAALEEMALNGQHITLDAGLVLDLLKAHAKTTGSAS